MVSGHVMGSHTVVLGSHTQWSWAQWYGLGLITEWSQGFTHRVVSGQGLGVHAHMVHTHSGHGLGGVMGTHRVVMG